ncbi:MAG: hypothetical protein ACK56I_37560, partial [bacterium]
LCPSMGTLMPFPPSCPVPISTPVELLSQIYAFPSIPCCLAVAPHTNHGLRFPPTQPPPKRTGFHSLGSAHCLRHLDPCHGHHCSPVPTPSGVGQTDTRFEYGGSDRQS